MQLFSVRYHDGKVSASHDATLMLAQDHWLIQYQDQSGEPQSVRWGLDKITPERNFTSLYILRYGDFPQQIIECKDESLPEELVRLYPDNAFYKKSRLAWIGKNNVLIIGLLLSVAGLLWISYYYVLPFAAEKIAGNIPQNMEVSVGESLYERIIAGYQVDEPMSLKVNAFASGIDFKTSYPIRITVVKENQVNAFALPGGHIVVYDKILREMRSKEELAALLAHEVSHVHYRHSLKSMFRTLGSYLFISLLLNDINGIVAVLADNSNMLLNLTYSRSLETEADQKAMESLQKQGISLKGFVDLFKTLQKQEQGEIAGLLTTHPLTSERMERAVAYAREQTLFRDQSALQKKWEALELRP